MNRTKIAAIVFILSAGVIASYAILKNSAPKFDLTKSGLTEENAESSIAKNPIKWLSRTVSKLNDFVSGKESDEAKISLPQNIDFENFNLTEFVAKSSFTQMKNLDQSGKDPFEIDPNDPASKEFIEKAIASISDPSVLFSPTIDDKDLKISQNNSKEAKKKYFDAIGKVMLENINSDYRNPMIAMQNFASNYDVSGIKRIIDAYSKMLNGVVNTEVPSDYLEIHKRYIVFLKKAKMVYSAIANYDKDPVKATLSAKLITGVAEADLAIKEEYADKVLQNLQSK
jgi:hypothetical protein